MNRPPEDSPGPHRLTLASAAFVALVGVAVLVGWASGLGPLKSVVPGLVEMKANTAACFVLAGLALGLARARVARAIPVGLSGAVLAVALATIAEYLAGRDFGIDRFLFEDPVSVRMGLPPGRMALATAVAFALTGASLILVARRRSPVAAQALTLLAVLIPLASLLAYLFGERAITATSPYTSLAINTAVAFAALGAGILRECSAAGPMAVLVGEGPGGTSLRRLLTLSVATTLALGFAAFLGARAGLYSHASGMVLFAVVTSVALSAVIWANGWLLDRAERARRRDRDWLQLTLRSIGDAVIATDRGGRVQFLNPVAEGLTGWASGEAEGLPLASVFRIVHESTRVEAEDPVARVLATGAAVGLANHTVLIARGGAERPIDDSAAPIRDDRGETTGVVLVFRDVTDRRRAEAEMARLREEERAAAGRAVRILESITDGFFALDRGWRFTYVNPRFEQILGLAAGRVLGGVLWEVYPGLLENELGRMYRRVVAARAAESATSYYPDHDRWYEVHAYPAPDGLSIYFRDVTDRERAEEERRRLDERRRLALDSARLGSWNIDPAAEALESDERFRAIFGVAGGRCSYQQAVEALHPEDRDRVLDAIAASTRPDDPQPYSLEYRVVHPGGAIRWVSVKGRSNFTGEGAGRRLTSFDGTIADVTDRRRAEEEVRANEERYRTLFESMDEGFCVIEVLFDPAGRPDDYRFLEMNPAFEGHTGLRGAIGRRVRELAPDLDGSWYETYGRVAVTGEPVRFVSEAKALQGRWFDVNAFRLGGPDSRKVAVLFNDITDRKRAEEATRRRASQLQRLADVANRINSAHDVRSVVGVVTEEARHLVDARRAETSLAPDPRHPQPIHVVSAPGGPLAGTAPPDLGGPGSPDLGDGADEPIRLTRGELDLDPRWRTSGGPAGPGPAPNGWLAVPLTGRNGRRLGLIQLSGKEEGEFTADDEAILVQLARLAAIAIENARLYQELRANDERKDEFLAMLAHELRNPLAAIGNAVKLASATGAREQLDWSIGVITRQMRHLARLIDDLMDVSRITRGKIELRRDVIDLAPLLESAAATVGALVEERGHTLELAVAPGALWVDVDPTRLEQVVVNLLNNAAKYSEDGGHIRLSARAEAGEVVVGVKDRGLGIPPERLPEMFELFAQGDRSLARSEGGLGIGLTVVKKLVEMHGGAVQARSEGPGRGSEFTIRLPAATGPARAPSPAAGPDRGPSRRARILVVDDNVDTVRGMARLLKLLGHEVATAHGGPEAIEEARAFRPEFVLLDIGLPGMSGYEVAGRLRREESCAGAVIVAVSGYGQDEDRRRSREAGFDHHLTKPLDHDALLALLSAGEDVRG